MENLRPNEQRAKNAILLIWIVFAIEIVNLLSSYMQYDLLQTIANGGIVSDETIESNDTREVVVGIIYFIAYLISGITFIMWFRRAYFNLHQKVSSLSFRRLGSRLLVCPNFKSVSSIPNNERNIY